MLLYWRICLYYDDFVHVYFCWLVGWWLAWSVYFGRYRVRRGKLKEAGIHTRCCTVMVKYIPFGALWFSVRFVYLWWNVITSVVKIVRKKCTQVMWTSVMRWNVYVNTFNMGQNSIVEMGPMRKSTVGYLSRLKWQGRTNGNKVSTGETN